MIPSLRLARAGARIGVSCGDTAAPWNEGSTRRHGISDLLDHHRMLEYLSPNSEREFVILTAAKGKGEDPV
jgi:hypothetical protein